MLIGEGVVTRIRRHLHDSQPRNHINTHTHFITIPTTLKILFRQFSVSPHSVNIITSFIKVRICSSTFNVQTEHNVIRVYYVATVINGYWNERDTVSLWDMHSWTNYSRVPLLCLPVMWSETVGLNTRPGWNQKIGLGLAHLMLCCETRFCHAYRHNDLEGHSNFSCSIYSFSILCSEHHYCGDQQWHSFT